MFRLGYKMAISSVILMVALISMKRADAQNVTTLSEDEAVHPCARDCQAGDAMECYYHFKIESYHSMSKACYDCPYVEADCRRQDCIPADGVNRSLTVVNRMMPGPAIVVCLGDDIIVDVENSLMSESTSIHWHGLHQIGSPHMDGVPHITQCPIPPHTTFRYHFKASDLGTQFWHPHIGLQRSEGASGALVIKQSKQEDVHGHLYDYDRNDHIMIVTDWLHIPTISKFTESHYSSGGIDAPTLLINGLGRFEVFNETIKYMNVSRFNVEQGYRYRFRVINVEFMNCPIELSVDGHNITIIATDGYDVEPTTATSIVTFAGERFDFILEADNEVDNYWIRYRGLLSCSNSSSSARQVAVLHYEGAADEEPAGELTWEESYNEGILINPLNTGNEDRHTLSIAKLRSITDDDEALALTPDYQFYIAYDLYEINNTDFHRAPYYGYNQVAEDLRYQTPQLNHISMKMPSSPLLIARPSDEEFCNSTTVPDFCHDEHCSCTHVIQVPINSVVELIIVDEGITFNANHAFHLHGHAFRVLAMTRLSNSTSVEEIQAYDDAGYLVRNFDHPPMKDTVTVPDGGFTVLRFKATNPGLWLFHCHIEFHVEVGMALVFKVGEYSDMVPIPPNFPTCEDYTPDF